MRLTAHRAVVMSFLLLLAALPAAGEEGGASTLIVETEADGTTLRMAGEAPFHHTTRVVSDSRVIAVPGTSTRLALWNELDAAGGVTPFYSIGLDDRAMGPGKSTSYRIKLRHGEFDPELGVPGVTDALADTGAGGLHIVQFATQPLESFRAAIHEQGGTVLGFLANHAHVVRMKPDARDRVAALPFVRWVGPYHPAYRLEEFLLDNRERASERYPLQRYNILVFEVAGKQAVAGRIAALGGRVDRADAGKFLLEATLTPAQLFEVVRWDEVQFVDRWSPFERDMDVVREIGGADYLESVAGYTGQGVRAEIFDAGFNVNHPDFASRPLLQHGGTVGNDSHGTATAGINFGDGTGDPKARGLMPDGQGIVADYNNVGLTGATRYTHTGELLQAPYFAVFQTASVGSSRTTAYTTISADHDTLLFDWDILHCQSQSNAGDQMSRPQAWAKNVLSGGAVNHYDTLTRSDDCWCSTASIGPASDGRIKPDLCFFYDDTWTTYSTGDGYGEFGGTSGATPSICGYAGLFFQMWSDGIFGNEVDPGGTVFENRPHMTTAKAFMINTATQYAFSGQSHDLTRVHQGWGMPSVQTLYDMRDNISFIDESVLLANTESVEFNAMVDSGEPALKVTLTYADPAGNPASSQHRINDLTLKVTSPSATVYWGNNGLLDGNWSVPGGSANTIDTVENVFVENPEQGLWIVEVIASEVNQDGHVETPELDADFALVVSGAFMTTCTSDGRISLDGAQYACEDVSALRVVDCDLNTDDATVQTVTVTIDSDSEPGGEDVLLTETGPATATFQGSIPLSETDAAGVLLVAGGDTVTATYIDADDGMGGTNLPKTDEATVDCTPPVISNVQAIDVRARSATVTFDTDEPARGTLHYGLACGSLTLSAGEIGFTTGHSIDISGLTMSTTYFYSVDAEDLVGNASTDDNGGACYSFTTTAVPDFFTELYDVDNDTDFLRLRFAPDGSTDFYAGCAEPVSAFPTDPSGGTVLSLTDDTSVAVNLGGGATVSLYGTSYATFHVGSNGYITFNGGDSDYTETLAEHFGRPRIAALYDDLNPASAGTVSWKQLADRAVVTFEAVPEYSESTTNDFQIEMFFDGTIAISYLAIDADDGIAGLSEGLGLSPDFEETDLSLLSSCGNEMCYDGMLNQSEERIDCGGPCPACECLSNPMCEDTEFCNGSETCDAFGICRSSGNPCGALECDEVHDACIGCDSDGVCEPGEDCGNCPTDCISDTGEVCGNGVCETLHGEDCLSCPEDCNGVQKGKPADRYCCGDGTAGENPIFCGDARCDAVGNTCNDQQVLAYCCGDWTCEDIETVGNCAPDCTPTVPGEAGYNDRLVVTGFDEATGMLSISFGVPCAAVDHTIEYAELTRANLAAHAWSSQECGLGASGAFDWSTSGAPESLFFVVVANNGAEEGSYGRDSDGTERPGDSASSTCPMVQNLPYACE